MSTFTVTSQINSPAVDAPATPVTSLGHTALILTGICSL